jgi:hypothetical protein
MTLSELVKLRASIDCSDSENCSLCIMSDKVNAAAGVESICVLLDRIEDAVSKYVLAAEYASTKQKLSKEDIKLRDEVAMRILGGSVWSENNIDYAFQRANYFMEARKNDTDDLVIADAWRNGKDGRADYRHYTERQKQTVHTGLDKQPQH